MIRTLRLIFSTDEGKNYYVSLTTRRRRRPPQMCSSCGGYVWIMISSRSRYRLRRGSYFPRYDRDRVKERLNYGCYLRTGRRSPQSQTQCGG